jgi:hypothetical protein
MPKFGICTVHTTDLRFFQPELKPQLRWCKGDSLPLLLRSTLQAHRHRKGSIIKSEASERNAYLLVNRKRYLYLERSFEIHFFKMAFINFIIQILKQLRLRNVIVANYPAYLGREFQLLKSTVGGPGKPLIAVFGDELVPDAKLLTRACSGVIYIRPLNPILDDDTSSEEDQNVNSVQNNETRNSKLSCLM